MYASALKKFNAFISEPRHIAPLAVLRIAFGSIMLISTLRFLWKGWVNTFYIQPSFHFTFYGFNWIQVPGAAGMYLLFLLMILSAALITLGLFYRAAILTFFLAFTYVELLDKTTYLNHYYLVSVMAFLLILVPANRYFSLDTRRKPSLALGQVPRWCIGIFRLQLVLVYFFAGISKLNYDWLIAAMPLRIWLPASSHLPVIGDLLTREWVAYAFSWFGALFDLVIGFSLLYDRSRKPAYLLVVIFHLVTGWFFSIGMFPWIMILVTLIFFSEKTHLSILRLLKSFLRLKDTATDGNKKYILTGIPKKGIVLLLCLHFSVQLVLPFRYLLYPGKLYWTEEGYRFSWRVMLMEKGGTAFFHVQDPATGRRSEINNAQYLTGFQERMMATQPDMILQYAHFLAREYQKKGIKDPIVTAETYVTLNGSGSMLYVDTTVNLAHEQETFGHKRWILPFNQKKHE